MWYSGWKITGNYRSDITKKIIIMAPHTSSRDLWLGLMCRPLLGDKIQFVAKAEAFKPAIVGWFLKWIGGIPVNRDRSTNFVRAVVNEYEKRDSITIVLTPEGTRRQVSKLKTGFYYIAVKSNVPVILCLADYPSRIVHFCDPIYLGPNIEFELNRISNHFKLYTGYHPDQSFRG